MISPPVTVLALALADTRAKFSQESAGGNMTEAIVDVRGCDFSNQVTLGSAGAARC
jgi:hypothetical protein